MLRCRRLTFTKCPKVTASPEVKERRYCTDPLSSNEAASNKNGLLSIICGAEARRHYNKTEK